MEIPAGKAAGTPDCPIPVVRFPEKISTDSPGSVVVELVAGFDFTELQFDVDASRLWVSGPGQLPGSNRFELRSRDYPDQTRFEFVLGAVAGSGDGCLPVRVYACDRWRAPFGPMQFATVKVGAAPAAQPVKSTATGVWDIVKWFVASFSVLSILFVWFTDALPRLQDDLHFWWPARAAKAFSYNAGDPAQDWRSGWDVTGGWSDRTNNKRPKHLLIAGPRVVGYARLTPAGAQLYDFKMTFTVWYQPEPAQQTLASWIVRADPKKPAESGYLFRLGVNAAHHLELKGYRRTAGQPEPLDQEARAIPYKDCCQKGDNFVIDLTVKAYTIETGITRTNSTHPEVNLPDERIPFQPFEDSRREYRYGRFGLSGGTSEPLLLHDIVIDPIPPAPYFHGNEAKKAGETK